MPETKKRTRCPKWNT